MSTRRWMEAPAQRPPVLSAVVCAYRDEATILRAVQSLNEQECDDLFEIVVATSGGDRTAEVVRASYPDVRVLESPTRLLPGGTRNLGISGARGEIIAFLEADCVATPGWVRSRIALHRAGHGAVASAVTSDPRGGVAARAWVLLVHAARLPGHHPGPADRYRAYGLSFTRDLLERAGPFDEMLRTDEDTLMAERLQELGVVMWFDPAVCIEHIGPTRLLRLVKDQFRRGILSSWWEILFLPPGRLRLRLQRARWATTFFVFLRSFSRLGKRVSWTASEVRNVDSGSGGQAAGTLVAVALGLIAHQIGWILDQLRAVSSSPTAHRRQLPPPTGVRRRLATTGERVVALTFDGVTRAHTGEILGVLADHQVSGAFFVSGATAEAEFETVRHIAVAGHLVGGGGWDRALAGLSAEEVVSDVARGKTVLEEITGEPVRHVRPKGGQYDLVVTTALDEMGLACWLWTDHPRVAGIEFDFDQILDATLGGLVPGAVIALPGAGADARRTAGLLPALIEGCRGRGFRFATLDEYGGMPFVGRSRPRPTVLSPEQPTTVERAGLRSTL
jgi:peptidoglycan/xylan/chitin deacetylase (PgdA/CDA1 family)/glycosyltransferase involved in cell wall biosynthesis